MMSLWSIGVWWKVKIWLIWNNQSTTLSPMNRGISNLGIRGGGSWWIGLGILGEKAGLCWDMADDVVAGNGSIGGCAVTISNLASFTIISAITVCCDANDHCNASKDLCKVSNPSKCCYTVVHIKSSFVRMESCRANWSVMVVSCSSNAHDLIIKPSVMECRTMKAPNWCRLHTKE